MVANLDAYASANKVPRVQPVEINFPTAYHESAVQRPYRVGYETCVVWPDIQAGFSRDMRTGALTPTHSRSALDLALQLTTQVQPDRVVLLGDNLDLPDWSLKFLRSPEFYWSAQAAAVEIAWWIGQIRRVVGPDVPIDYIEGNHEYRMSVALQANLIAAYDLRPADDLDGEALLTIPRLLGLEALGVSYYGPYPNGQVWLNDNLRLHHGLTVRSKSGDTVRAVVNEISHSEGQGHIHRLELATRTTWTAKGPRTNMAFSPGSLCSLDPGVVPGAGGSRNWQNGIAVVEYEPGNGDFHVDLVSIHEGRAFYAGAHKARPDREIIRAIESDTNYKVH